jgi:hypothetical protein
LRAIKETDIVQERCIFLTGNPVPVYFVLCVFILKDFVLAKEESPQGAGRESNQRHALLAFCQLSYKSNSIHCHSSCRNFTEAVSCSNFIDTTLNSCSAISETGNQNLLNNLQPGAINCSTFMSSSISCILRSIIDGCSEKNSIGNFSLLRSSKGNSVGSRGAELCSGAALTAAVCLRAALTAVFWFKSGFRSFSLC